MGDEYLNKLRIQEGANTFTNARRAVLSRKVMCRELACHARRNRHCFVCGESEHQLIKQFGHDDFLCNGLCTGPLREGTDRLFTIAVKSPDLPNGELEGRLVEIGPYSSRRNCWKVRCLNKAGEMEVFDYFHQGVEGQ